MGRTIGLFDEEYALMTFTSGNNLTDLLASTLSYHSKLTMNIMTK
jgi:hypothetical protein